MLDIATIDSALSYFYESLVESGHLAELNPEFDSDLQERNTKDLSDIMECMTSDSPSFHGTALLFKQFLRCFLRLDKDNVTREHEPTLIALQKVATHLSKQIDRLYYAIPEDDRNYISGKEEN